ncbi:ABC transporter ATP-binding protein [Streptomyces luteireticuli]|uniref:ABC transporter ATP-binding protein n=1 Tax=Streptomyces luteireticuli TaxID=173858 RepID=UPI003558A2B7
MSAVQGLIPQPSGLDREDDVLTAEGLTKTFGTRTVVDGLSLRVGAGEILGFLGPNGAGKSTAIAMLTGILPPDRGAVTIDGLPLGGRTARTAKSRIGVVPQEIALYPSLTARQNLRFFAGVQGLRGAARDGRVDWALEVTGLTDRAADTVSSYSGGMQRRLNIAAGLLHRPRIVFLDEPTVGVDAQSRGLIFETVLRLRRELGMSVVYTSHYMPEVEQLCDRIVIIDRGRLLAEGTRDELVAPLGDGLLRWELPGGAPEAVRRELAAHGRVESEDVPGGTALVITAHDLARALRAVTDLAVRHRLPLTGLRLDRPDLESLFLHLTGRAIRDGS